MVSLEDIWFVSVLIDTGVLVPPFSFSVIVHPRQNYFGGSVL